MAKIFYSSLKIKQDKSTIPLEWEGHTIEILKYLPITDKNDLIMITMQESEENGVYNPNKLELYFNLNLVYMYTNLSFSEKQKDNPAETYDRLKSIGLLDEIIESIPDSEYSYLYNTLNDYIDTILTYKNTASSVIQTIIQDLPKNAEAAATLVNNFDKEKFQSVIDLANKVKGGESIT